MSSKKKLLGIAIFLWAIVASRKIYLFMGVSQKTASSLKVFVYPDIELKHTLILQKDFECKESNGCLIFDSRNQTMQYQGQQLVYVTAQTQISMLPQPFKTQTTIRYIIEHPSIMESVLGVHPESEFLHYFSAQNLKQYQGLNFKLDWENNFTIKGDIMAAVLLPVEIAMIADVSFSKSSSPPPGFPQTQLKLCLTNMLDHIDKIPSFFGVAESMFEQWRSLSEKVYGMVYSGPNALAYNFQFYIRSAEGMEIGDMEFHFEEMYNEKGGLMIKSVPDSWGTNDMCDIYTGSLMLRKQGYEFFFVEVARGKYNVLWTFDGFESASLARFDNPSSLGLELFIFLAVFVVVAILVYFFMLKPQSHANSTEEHQEPPSPVRLVDRSSEHSFRISNLGYVRV